MSETDSMEDTADILHYLQHGTISTDGYVPWGSNYTFVVTMTLDGVDRQAVYKPRQGERPLWDFPTGTLCSRERAAYLVSEAAGWHIVPPTVLRQGPHGWGSVQHFIDHDPEENYFTFKEIDDYDAALQTICLFDLVVNNADRKGGHVICDYDGRLWGIDHGIAFHEDPKLRTVIWDFVGRSLTTKQLSALTDLLNELKSGSTLCPQLQELLNRRELDALRRRVQNLIDKKTFPDPGPGRPYPWPLV